eukprot:gene28221-6068_t
MQGPRPPLRAWERAHVVRGGERWGGDTPLAKLRARLEGHAGQGV